MSKVNSFSFLLIAGLTVASSAFAECPKDRDGKEVCAKTVLEKSKDLAIKAKDAYGKTGLEIKPSIGGSVLSLHPNITGTGLEAKEWHNGWSVGGGYNHSDGDFGSNGFVEAGKRLGNKSDRRFIDVDARYGSMRLIQEGLSGRSKELRTDGEFAVGKGFTVYEMANVGRISAAGSSGNMHDVVATVGYNIKRVQLFGFSPEVRAGLDAVGYNLSGPKDLSSSTIAPKFGISLHHNRSKSAQ
jgi:hypothetical protein